MGSILSAVGAFAAGNKFSLQAFFSSAVGPGGMIFCGIGIYILSYKGYPEVLTLSAKSIHIDTGKFTLPSKSEYHRPNLFRQKFELPLNKIQTLKLEVTETSNKLTIDIGDTGNEERFMLAISATEIEREWLYEYLKKQY